jgi:hypothetical protein
MTLVFKSGRHVEALLVNIISDGFLDGDGYLSIFRNTQYKITKENLIVSEDKMASILYHIHASFFDACVNALRKHDVCALWHKRLGHRSGMLV